MQSQQNSIRSDSLHRSTGGTTEDNWFSAERNYNCWLKDNAHAVSAHNIETMCLLPYRYNIQLNTESMSYDLWTSIMQHANEVVFEKLPQPTKLCWSRSMPLNRERSEINSYIIERQLSLVYARMIYALDDPLQVMSSPWLWCPTRAVHRWYSYRYRIT